MDECCSQHQWASVASSEGGLEKQFSYFLCLWGLAKSKKLQWESLLERVLGQPSSAPIGQGGHTRTRSFRRVSNLIIYWASFRRRMCCIYRLYFSSFWIHLGNIKLSFGSKTKKCRVQPSYTKLSFFQTVQFGKHYLAMLACSQNGVAIGYSCRKSCSKQKSSMSYSSEVCIYWFDLIFNLIDHPPTAQLLTWTYNFVHFNERHIYAMNWDEEMPNIQSRYAA